MNMFNTGLQNVGAREKKTFKNYKKPLLELPDLFEGQVQSFKWLLTDGIKDVLKEFSPVSDYSGKKFEMDFVDFEMEEPKYDDKFARENKLTYEASIKFKIKLFNKTLGSEKEQEIFMADFPLMTKSRTFIINGIERVIVPQLARSFGVIFTSNLISKDENILEQKLFLHVVLGLNLKQIKRSLFMFELIRTENSRYYIPKSSWVHLQTKKF
jgi:DNA-directed RNA polymerase beta subunit